MNDSCGAAGAAGQNPNRAATAVTLHFDIAKSSLSEDVKARLRVLAGRHVTADGVLVVDSRTFRSQTQNRKRPVPACVAPSSGLQRLLRPGPTPGRGQRPEKKTQASVEASAECRQVKPSADWSASARLIVSMKGNVPCEGNCFW